MPKEYEYRFSFNNKLTENILKNKLKNLKAIHFKPLLFTIYVFNLNNEQMYIRLRDEGNKKTFTIKKNLNNKFVDEYEINIDNIDILYKMLLLLGCTLKYKVEKIREIFKINDIEVVLDSYPGLPTYFEIEASSLNNLNNFCKLLEIDIPNTISKDMTYDIIYDLPKNRKITGNLTFKNAKKNFLSIINKNKKLFIETLKNQIKYLKLNNIKY